MSDQSETVVKLQKPLDEALEKVKTFEKRYREKVAEEKLLVMKLEEMEKIQNQSAFVIKPITPPQTSSPPPSTPSIPPIMTPPPMSEDGTLSKEELRMYKAINRVPTPGGSIRTKRESTSDSPRMPQAKADVISASSPQKTGTPPSRLSITGIPKTEPTSLSARGEVSDWKRRQLEKEKEAQEKLINEQQKKQELLQSLNQSVVEVTTIPNPLSGINSSEKEEVRLSRALNKTGRILGQKT